MNTRLSDAEIADLTGYIRPSSQIGWLGNVRVRRRA